MNGDANLAIDRVMMKESGKCLINDRIIGEKSNHLVNI